jgi:hypothetical protein
MSEFCKPWCAQPGRVPAHGLLVREHDRIRGQRNLLAVCAAVIRTYWTILSSSIKIDLLVFNLPVGRIAFVMGNTIVGIKQPCHTLLTTCLAP